MADTTASSIETTQAGDTNVLQAQPMPNGQTQFTLPIPSAQVKAVEVVDVDFVVVSTTGQRFVLPQGALTAATAPERSVLKFSDGNTVPLAEEYKKVGKTVPVEGGSYRIQASDLKPQVGSGAGNGQGIGPASTVAKSDAGAQSSAAEAQAQSVEVAKQMQQVMQQLQKISQTQQSASLSDAQSNAQSAATPQTEGKGPGTGVAKNDLASATAGAPPKAVEKTVTNTYTSNFSSNDVGKLDALRSIQHSSTAKLNGVELPGGASFGDIKGSALLPSAPVSVSVKAGNVVAPTSASGVGSGQTTVDLMLPGRPNAAKAVLTLVNPATSGLPDGFTINGQATANTPAGTTTAVSSPVSVVVNGSDIQRVALKWNTVADNATVSPLKFQFTVQFFDANGQLILGTDGAGSPPVTFYFADLRSQTEYNALGPDNNGNTTFYLPARGISYAIQGTSSPDNIQAGDGHDLVYGGAGNDTLNGGQGDDTLVGGAGADQIDGGTGNNTASYVGSDAGVQVSLVAGTTGASGHAQGDTLTNIRNLIGSDFDDTLTGDAQNNRLEGGKGNDTLIGGAGADTLDGGDGTNTVSYDSALARTPTADGTVKNTGVVASLLNPASNEGDAAGDSYTRIQNLTGSAYDDVLEGDANANRLEGANGDDTLIGGAGADALVGGAGIDTVSYAKAATGVTANLKDSSQNAGADAAGDTYDGIENVLGSAFNDLLVGDDNSNTLEGGMGNDTLRGGGGGDRLLGGEGSDTASYANATSGLRVNLSNPTSATLGNTGEAVGDTYNSIENLLGSAFDDQLMGNELSNTLSGGNGADTLIGGGGGDSLDGGQGLDTVSYETAAGSVTAYLTNSQQMLNAGAAVGDKYTAIENLKGSDYGDFLWGDANANRILGGKGNDTLGGGADLVTDVLDGEEGSDTVSYENSAATTGVVLSLSSGGSGGDATGDNYISIENAIGTHLADQITGDGSDNVLWGMAGDDILVGGGGSDTLYGGEGNDTLKNTGAGRHHYDGGAGTNTVSYEGFTTALNLNLTAIDGNSNGAGGSEFFTDIQNLTGGDKTTA